MRIAALALAVGLVLGVAACGGGGGNSGGQPAGSIKVTLTEFKFDPASIDAKSGTLTFFLVNGGSISHDLVIRDSSGNRLAGSDLISAGDSTVFTASNVAAGTYTYFCDQPGHEQSGMHGTLTVT
ncbi:MAG TPA: plastocyanin/azurin family copper-binding protein [Candidatus Dormibacteraeota bacterium]|nr:plastocyanin/azurin family copper-binding protein [Candidatus Dormibacteraeota bacterium]